MIDSNTTADSIDSWGESKNNHTVDILSLVQHDFL